MSLHEISIQGKSVSIGKAGAVEGWKLIHRLSKAMGPFIDCLGKGEIGEGIAKSMGSMSSDELVALLRDLTSSVLVDGRKFGEAEFSDYGFTLLVVTEVIKYNFSGFFLPIQQGLSGTFDHSKGKA
jgi:hypothetical protein